VYVGCRWSYIVLHSAATTMYPWHKDAPTEQIA